MQAMAQEVAVLSQRVHHLVDHFKSFNATFSEQSAKVSAHRAYVPCAAVRSPCSPYPPYPRHTAMLQRAPRVCDVVRLQHTKFEEQTVEGEQLRREEHAMEMLQFQEMFNGFKTVSGRLGGGQQHLG